MKKFGKVFIAGAGPGDPGLLTLRCAEILKVADVIIYDYLVDNQILTLARKDAQKIYVGKSGSRHEMEQDEINRLIVEKARECETVLRLKGGDPFVFGRGGEEAEFLKKEGVPFEIVPGISSVISCPAYAGIPLTHRESSSSVLVVTGHEAKEKNTSSIDWKLIASFSGTTVFLMGMKNLKNIVEELLKNGKDPRTKCSIIEWGTTPRQRVLISDLESVIDEAERLKMGPPAVIVIGEVVKFREKLRWFEDLPLFGKKIAITRPIEQSYWMAKILREKGAEVLLIPTIEIHPIIPNDPLDKAIDFIDSYHAIIFTSVNGVKIFFLKLYERGMDSRSLYGVKIVAIGGTTERELSSFGIKADYVPEDYTSEGIVSILEKVGTEGKRFLLPRAKEARDLIPEYIQRNGGIADVIPVYETRIPETPVRLSEIPDVLTFTSSSTVRNFVILYGLEVLRRTIIASIGPATTETLRSYGLDVRIEAKRHDVEGLVEEIVRYFTENCS